jgi:hypothetical protein
METFLTKEDLINLKKAIRLILERSIDKISEEDMDWLIEYLNP